MKLSDLRYITQENINEAYINVTSADMYKEAQVFNTHMFDMHRLYWRFRIQSWAVVLISLILVPLLTVLYGRDSDLTQVTVLTAFFWLNFAIAALYIFCFCFFVLYKKLYDWRICMLYSAVTFLNRESIYGILASLILLVTICALLFIMNKIDVRLKDEVGYPYFVQLRITTKTEKFDEPGTELLSFDQFKANELNADGKLEIPSLDPLSNILEKNNEL